MYVDADWTKDQDDGTSIAGSLIFNTPNLATWMLKKQATIFRSNIEVEYQAIVYAIIELLWFYHLLGELRVKLHQSPPFFYSQIASKRSFMVNHTSYSISQANHKVSIILIHNCSINRYILILQK